MGCGGFDIGRNMIGIQIEIEHNVIENSMIGTRGESGMTRARRSK